MPTTRASNSPKPKMSSRDTTPLATPTRKPPCCKQCGLPRQGHPRSGCPNTENDVLSSAMSSVKLNGSPRKPESKTHEPDWKLEDTPAALRQRRRQSHQPLVPSESLASISTSSSEIMNILTNPNDYDTDQEDDDKPKVKKIVHWQEAVGAAMSTPKKPRKSQAKTLMPGTLIAPTPDSSFASTTSTSSLPPPIVTYIEPSEISTSSAASSIIEPPTPKAQPVFTPKPLARAPSMSSVQRSSFIETLSTRYQRTTAFLLPKEDITAIEREALSHGLHTRRIASIETDEQEQMLVVGQDPADTEKFYATLEGRAKSFVEKKESGRGSGFKSAAGGMVVGAVAAVTTLAYA